MIPVTKPYLPNRALLDRYIDGIYERNWLTNDGELVRELTTRLENYLDVKNLLLVSNGTLALQIAFAALNLKQTNANAITTPFSFAATPSSLKWEGIQPIFTDIDPDTYCLAPSKIEAAIDNNTKAIVPVHVFGTPCNVVEIQKIADKYGLKVIYDGAHAFGVNFNNKSIFLNGDASTISFHATKLFHTAEGGAIIFKNRKDLERAKLLINFGIDGPDSIVSIGINAKMNELQAAMGLCVLDEIDVIFNSRGTLWKRYLETLHNKVQTPQLLENASNNYAYFPVKFRDESTLIKIISALKAQDVVPRRYFYPSLDTLEYLQPQAVQRVSRDTASRILCLPIFAELGEKNVDMICNTINALVE